MLRKAIPLLRIFDLAKAEEFCIDWLGFRSDWQHRFAETMPVYWQIAKDNLVLHLTEHRAEAVLWNALTMEVIDPFGNRLLFSEPA